MSAALDDPDPLIFNSRQLLKHVCRVMSKDSVDEDVLEAHIFSVFIPSSDYSQVIVTSFCTANACSPQDTYMAVTDSIY